jgi:nucleoside 2-deoxyribosyltransferase
MYTDTKSALPSDLAVFPLRGGFYKNCCMKIYLIGSLRNPAVPALANKIRELGFEVFDDWYAAGPEADDKWRDYEKGRGRTYKEALGGLAADHVYHFDLKHLNECSIAVLLLPAGKSGHLELGYVIGQGKPGYILLDTPERWDVMYKFAEGVCTSEDELLAELSKFLKPKS